VLLARWPLAVDRAGYNPAADLAGAPCFLPTGPINSAFACSRSQTGQSVGHAADAFRPSPTGVTFLVRSNAAVRAYSTDPHTLQEARQRTTGKATN